MFALENQGTEGKKRKHNNIIKIIIDRQVQQLKCFGSIQEVRKTLPILSRYTFSASCIRKLWHHAGVMTWQQHFYCHWRPFGRQVSLSATLGGCLSRDPAF